MSYPRRYTPLLILDAFVRADKPLGYEDVQGLIPDPCPDYGTVRYVVKALQKHGFIRPARGERGRMMFVAAMKVDPQPK